MHSELYWLACTLAATALFPFPYVLNRVGTRGLSGALANPSASADEKLAPWAQRAKKAHANAIENLVVFAPAVLVLEFVGRNSAATAAACVVYFAARVLHYVVYTAGIVGLRTLCYLAGWGATAVVILRALGWS